MGLRRPRSILWTPIASLPGGFLNGWSADATNVPQIGLVTVQGITFAVTTGLVKATSGAGATAMFNVPAGYRAVPASGPTSTAWLWFDYGGAGAGTNISTAVYVGSGNYVAAGYDGNGATFTAGNCKDVLLGYAWQVKS